MPGMRQQSSRKTKVIASSNRPRALRQKTASWESRIETAVMGGWVFAFAAGTLLGCQWFAYGGAPAWPMAGECLPRVVALVILTLSTFAIIHGALGRGLLLLLGAPVVIIALTMTGNALH